MISLQPVILIVDDSDEDRATLRRYLERAGPDGYRCHEASTAAEGLELCRVLHPDAILLDYSLPDDDGLEFLAALVAEHGPLACAVVMLTGAGNATVAVQALKLGAQDYLVKGHDIRQRVILALNGAIEKVQQQRQVEQQRRDLAASNQQLEQALQAQQASAAQLQLALQAASMATWQWDLASGKVAWSAGLEPRLGIPNGEFGDSFEAFLRLLHPDNSARVQQRLAQALRGEQPYEVEFRMLHADGDIRWTATSGLVVRDATGAATSMVGVDMDISERKRAELELRASEARLRAIWESASDAMVLSDAQGVVLTANPAYCELYGYSPEQLIGHSFTIIFPPDQRAAAVEQYGEIIRGDAVLPAYEAIIQRSNGEQRIVESSANVLVTSDGEVGLLSIVRDVTERQTITDQLRRSEVQFKTLVENAPDIIARFDRQLRHLYVSPMATRVTGLSQADYIGKTNRELGMPAEQCDLWEAQTRAVLADGQPHEYEFSFLSPAGLRYFQSKIVPEFAANGSVETVLSITRDITVNKRAEERERFLSQASKALTSSLDYQTTLEQIARLALPVLGDGCIIDLVENDKVSGTMVAHIDPQQEQLLREIHHAYPPQLDGTHPAAQVLRSGKSLMIDHVSQELLTQNIADDRQRMLVERLPPRSLIIVPLLLRGQTLGVIAVYATAAPRRYAADDLALLKELARRASIALDNARLYQEAQEAVREREAFMAIASHELKNPLTALLGRAQLLQRRFMRQGGAARELDDIKSIITTTQQINQLLVDLLDVAHVVDGQLNLNRASLDLGALIRQVAATMEESAPRHQISISAPQEPLMIAGDSIRLEQVFHNLLNNAIKYSPGGGKVAISIAVEEAHAVITVHDEGLGIPAAALPHLFKRFYRAPSSMSEQIAGTGIGLYVVKEIVSNHGGTVKVSSTEGLGSSFTVYLPLELT